MKHSSDPAFARHAASHRPVSDCPVVDGNAVELFANAADAIDAIFNVIAGARRHLHLEYYIADDIMLRGRGLKALLLDALGRGVQVAMIYDSAGCHRTPDAFFNTLEAAGAKILEFRPLNPLRRHFAWRLNDRDHRKLLVVDGDCAIMGGVNLNRVYENPESAGAAADARDAYWHDCAIRLRGPVVEWVQRIFLETWDGHGGKALADAGFFPTLDAAGTHQVRIAASSPLERKRLYFRALRAAIAEARETILLTTGYFVPSRRDWQALADAAARGVSVDLVLASVSDIPGTLHAARALYGRLLEAGVRIHEIQDGYVHAKAATIDGVWSVIGSSNFDRRSYSFNNEIDAVLLGHDMALALEQLLRHWIARSDQVTLADWRRRSVGERIAEYSARLWERYM